MKKSWGLWTASWAVNSPLKELISLQTSGDRAVGALGPALQGALVPRRPVGAGGAQHLAG